MSLPLEYHILCCSYLSMVQYLPYISFIPGSKCSSNNKPLDGDSINFVFFIMCLVELVHVFTTRMH